MFLCIIISLILKNIKIVNSSSKIDCENFSCLPKNNYDNNFKAYERGEKIEDISKVSKRKDNFTDFQRDQIILRDKNLMKTSSSWSEFKRRTGKFKKEDENIITEDKNEISEELQKPHLELKDKTKSTKHDMDKLTNRLNELDTNITENLNLRRIMEVKDSARNRNVKIINGTLTVPHEFPGAICLYHRYTLLYFIRFYEYKCTGVLITKKHILTAAHCLPNPNQRIIYHTNYIVAWGGSGDTEYINNKLKTSHNIADENLEDGQQVRKCKDWIRHPKYNHKKFIYDVGVIRCETDFVIIKNILEIIPVATYFNNMHETHVEMFGWGAIDNENDRSFILKKYTTTVIKLSSCKSKFVNISQQHHICTYNKYSQSYRGDSGAPALLTMLVYEGNGVNFDKDQENLHDIVSNAYLNNITANFSYGANIQKDFDQQNFNSDISNDIQSINKSLMKKLETINAQNNSFAKLPEALKVFLRDKIDILNQSLESNYENTILQDNPFNELLKLNNTISQEIQNNFSTLDENLGNENEFGYLTQQELSSNLSETKEKVPGYSSSIKQSANKSQSTKQNSENYYLAENTVLENNNTKIFMVNNVYGFNESNETNSTSMFNTNNRRKNSAAGANNITLGETNSNRLDSNINNDTMSSDTNINRLNETDNINMCNTKNISNNSSSETNSNRLESNRDYNKITSDKNSNKLDQTNSTNNVNTSNVTASSNEHSTMPFILNNNKNSTYSSIQQNTNNVLNNTDQVFNTNLAINVYEINQHSNTSDIQVQNEIKFHKQKIVIGITSFQLDGFVVLANISNNEYMNFIKEAVKTTNKHNIRQKPRLVSLQNDIFT